MKTKTVLLTIAILIAFTIIPYVSALPLNESTISDSTPLFSWVYTDDANTNYTLYVDDNSNFASPILVKDDIQTPAYTLTALEALSTDRTYYWKVDINESGVITNTTGDYWFILDTTAPIIQTFSPNNDSWRTSSPAATNIGTNENSECRYSTNPATDWNTKIVMAGAGTSHTGNFALGTQGENSFYVQCEDTYGNRIPLADQVHYTLKYDNIAPTLGTALIDLGNQYTNSSILNLTWAGFSDATSGIEYYYYSFSDNSGSSSGTRVADTVSTANVNNGATDGTRTLYVWAEDIAGNIASSAISDSIIADYTDPQVTSWVDNPGTLRYDHVGAYQITIGITEANLDVTPTCRYTFDNTTYSAWQNTVLVSGTTYRYSITETWNNHAGDILTTECRIRDAVYHSVTEIGNEYIVMNQNPPSFVGLTDKIGDEDYNLTFTIQASDIDNDELTFTSNMTGFVFARIDSSSVVASWVPNNDNVGNNSIQLSVDDGSFTTSQTINIEIRGTNDAPILESIGNLEAYLHEPFKQYIYGTDPDNQNTATNDDDYGAIFSTVENLRWFKTQSAFNFTNMKYVGLINFTPLLSHKGKHNITISLDDGNGIDTENIIFSVGYCGDKDDANEPKCDTEYEDCESCPKDCGKCDVDEVEAVSIITNTHRNCLYRNFTMSVYELYERGTCDIQGSIIGGMEVCQNISGANVKIYKLDDKEWIEHGNYLTDNDGIVEFVPQEEGSYKIEGEYKKYKKAIKYLDFKKCEGIDSIDDAIDNDEMKNNSIEEEINTAGKNNETKNATTETPGQVENEDDIPGEEIGEAGLLSTIIFYIIVPFLLIGLAGAGYIYYENNKNSSIKIMKFRIAMIQKRKEIKAKIIEQINKIKTKVQKK